MKYSTTSTTTATLTENMRTEKINAFYLLGMTYIKDIGFQILEEYSKPPAFALYLAFHEEPTTRKLLHGGESNPSRFLRRSGFGSTHQV